MIKEASLVKGACLVLDADFKKNKELPAFVREQSCGIEQLCGIKGHCRIKEHCGIKEHYRIKEHC